MYAWRRNTVMSHGSMAPAFANCWMRYPIVCSSGNGALRLASTFCSLKLLVRKRSKIQLNVFSHFVKRRSLKWKPPSARNRILFDANEVPSDGVILLPPGDSRAQHITAVLNLPVGGSLKIGIINGKPGTARVEGNIDDKLLVGPSVHLRVTEWGPHPPLSRLSLLLAMPRPKAMRRLWSILGQLGLSHIMIVNAARVERFYFDSQALSTPAIRQELLLGLEQAGDTRLPEVTVHMRLKPLLDQISARDVQDKRSNADVNECSEQSEHGNANLSFANTVLLLAHPGIPCRIVEALQDAETGSLQGVGGSSKLSFSGERQPASLKVLLAVGPEGGWTPFEVAMFQEFGFKAVGLGPRPLRTDVALVALITHVKECLQDW